jgi:hypothetical protein
MYELRLGSSPTDERTLKRAVEAARSGIERDERWVVAGVVPSRVLGAGGACEWLIHARRRDGSRGVADA